MNLKEAIDYIALAWNNVNQTTIQNCWIKTGILPLYDNSDIDDDMNIGDDINTDDEEVEDLLNELPEVEKVRNYFEMFDHEIPTENALTEEQIVNMVMYEQNQMERESDSDDDDEEIHPISVEKAVDGLPPRMNGSNAIFSRPETARGAT